jgi:restriction endonuclease S subunit
MSRQIIELKKVTCSIFSGAPLYSVPPSNKGIVSGLPLINIKDIVVDQVDWRNLLIIPLDEIRKPERFYVESGDVLITCRGTQFKVAVIPEKIPCGLITANLIAIRPNHNQLSSVYLAAYLRSKDGERELLARRTSQTAQIVLSVSNIEELRIPLPPLSVQEKIARAVETLDEEYRLNQAAVELNRRIRSQIIVDLLDQNR